MALTAGSSRPGNIPSTTTATARAMVLIAATGESPHAVTERFKDSTARNKFGKKKELWGNFKFPNMWVVGVSEGEVMRETEKVFEEIMAPNFPHWMKTINPQIPEAK